MSAAEIELSAFDDIVADLDGFICRWDGRCVARCPYRVERSRTRIPRGGHGRTEGALQAEFRIASISIAVRDAAGKLVMESLIETKAATILEFFQGLKGTLCVAFEEGTSAAWLYDLLKPHVANVIVCDPRKNALLKTGNKNDRVDARKLSELLRAGLLTPVYHGESGVRTLRELTRSYLTLSKDLTRVIESSQSAVSKLGDSLCR